jgi:hypothetical protein
MPTAEAAGARSFAALQVEAAALVLTHCLGRDATVGAAS